MLDRRGPARRWRTAAELTVFHAIGCEERPIVDERIFVLAKSKPLILLARWITMRLGRSNLDAYDVIDSNKLERDLSEKPHSATGGSARYRPKHSPMKFRTPFH
jgi:hypothetical protein